MNRERIETGLVIGREATNTTDGRGVILLSGPDNFAYVLVNNACHLRPDNEVKYFAPNFVNTKLDIFRGVRLTSTYNDAISIDSEVCKECPYGGARPKGSTNRCPSYEADLGKER